MSRSLKTILIVLAVLIVVVVGASLGVTIYGWRAAVREGNKHAAVQNLKTIGMVEIQYYNTHKRSFGTFDQLVKEQMLDARFAGNAPVVDGYVFTLVVTPRAENVVSSFSVRADPQAGNDHFYLDSTDGMVHVNSNKPAGPEDPEPNY